LTRAGVPPGGYCHLHVRSGFSYGLGTATPEELAEGASRAGYRALALTDRDGLYGIPRFLRACGETALTPIVGAEITVKLGNRDGGEGNPGHRGHVVLLAGSGRAYRSLCRLLTAYLLAPTAPGSPWPSAAERRSSACGLETLLEHAGGENPGGDLICLTGAVPFGLVPSLALSRDAGLRRKAAEVVSLLREAFGEGNVFVELSDDGTQGSRGRMRAVEYLADRCAVPTVATGEVTYLRPEDHRLSEALAAHRSLSPLPPPHYRPTDALYLRTPGEMSRLFADRPEALKNTATIAERCGGAVDLLGRGVLVPSARLPGGSTEDGALARLALAGAKRLYPAASRGEPGVFPSKEELRSRLRKELRVIAAQRFSGYFLVAHEAAEIARSLGTPVTGRGSAANSLVARSLGLTTPCPFAHRLLFERFMHEGRKDPPDIDLDFCSERRDAVRDELMRRHREPGAAVAATANTLSLRGAVRVAARALGYTPTETDALAKNVPRRIRDRDRLVNYDSEWDAALSSPAMRGHPLQDRERYALLLELAEDLEGKLQGPGTHLGGLVLGAAGLHLSEIVPLEPSGKEGLIRCQFDKDDLELVGLPKLDLLGLKTHTALDKAARMVSRRLGRKVEPLSLPQDDKRTYSLIRSGETVGLFQLESPGQMALQRRLGARRLPHIVAGISLFRPGPLEADLVTSYVARKQGRERVSYPLTEIEEILRETYGVLIYQESVLEVAAKLTGCTLAEGDRLRRAMTRDRGPGAMRELRSWFVGRAAGRGVDRRKAEEVFSWVEGFGRYGFSAAHAASFAEISYASAYMMAHWPAETTAGILNSQPMGFYSPRVLLNEARRKGVRVLPPDVHLSGEDFTVERDGRALRPGLSYCRGLSEKAISSILSERERRPFASVADLYRRTPVGRNVLQNLIRAGFLDRLHPRGSEGRAALLDETRGLPPKRRRGTQRELPLPHPASWWESREGRGPIVASLPPPVTELERWEARVLGLDLRRHPLSAHREALAALGVVPGRELRELPHGTRARTAGVLECLQAPPTRSGALVHFLLTEDESGLLQSTVFERCYRRFGHVLYETDAYLVEGRVEQDERRGFSFLVERIAPLEDALRRAGGETRSSTLEEAARGHRIPS
jgi:error-prone DNA polymerase